MMRGARMVPCSCRLLLCPRTAVFCYCSWAPTWAWSMLCKGEMDKWENPRNFVTEVDSSCLILLWRICDNGSTSRSWELWVQHSVLVVGCNARAVCCWSRLSKLGVSTIVVFATTCKGLMPSHTSASNDTDLLDLHWVYLFDIIWPHAASCAEISRWEVLV
jgi:hypothetical protein